MIIKIIEPGLYGHVNLSPKIWMDPTELTVKEPDPWADSDHHIMYLS